MRDILICVAKIYNKSINEKFSYPKKTGTITQAILELLGLLQSHP